MVERFLRQSPLAHLGLAGQGRTEIGEASVAMAERPFPAIVDLRGAHKDLAAPLKAAFGFSLPSEANRAGGKDTLTVLWLGPDQWWLVDDAAEIIAATVSETLKGQSHAATNVGESRTCIRLSGPKVHALLAKGCPLDLHPGVFPEGACAQTLLAKAGVLIHHKEGGIYELYVLRSFADYLWHWLADAAQEYGLAVLTR